MPFPIAVSCEARVEQWWVRSPPTYVARVQIPASTPYVGWVCCWFSPLLREVFLRVLRFSSLLKNLHFQIPIRPGIRWLCGLLTNPSHFFDLGRGKTPKLELFWIVCNFYVLSLCSYRDLSRATASFHKCFCFVDGVTSWGKKKKRKHRLPTLILPNFPLSAQPSYTFGQFFSHNLSITRRRVAFMRMSVVILTCFCFH